MNEWNNASPDRKLAVYEELAATLKALASGRRLELIELLAQGEHSVELLARMSASALTTTSANLQVLKRAGLVETRREGTTIHYRLAGDDVAELFLAAKRVGLARSPELRERAAAYLAVSTSTGREPVLIDADQFDGDAVLLDVRPAIEYDGGHLAGAVSIPLEELLSRHTEIPSDRAVVVYCRGEFCRLARQAAAWLCEHGYDAKAMDEGVIEWRVDPNVDLDLAG